MRIEREAGLTAFAKAAASLAEALRAKAEGLRYERPSNIEEWNETGFATAR